MATKLDFNAMTNKWQDKWNSLKIYESEPNSDKKFFMIFAYPGISGFLHIGHMRGYSYADAICRYKRMDGFNVLFPVGTHASGNQAIAFAKKVRDNDLDWINYLKNNGCPDDIISTLTTPEKIVDYFNKVYIETFWKKFGFISDWRRFTCTTYPDYGKFMQWQFKKLNDKNLLVQKPYFATACINCGPVAVDPSETDISKGGNAEKVEFTILKFKLEENTFLVAATLRPETVYGQTNLWINPENFYVKVSYKKEILIMSLEAFNKLKYQKDGVAFIENISGKDLVGKFVEAPGINRKIMVLPSEFVDMDFGTGIVTSVPSDAPYDYIALLDLQNDIKLCNKYGIDNSLVKEISLIPIITSKGFGKFPAKEIVEKMGIKSQNDKDKLDLATKEIYKAGFHTGIMTETAGIYSGKKVEVAKELIKEKLIEDNLADEFIDLSEDVICRCGDKVIIKRIDDQWFIRYSDSELTIKSKEHAKSMNILPVEYANNIEGVLDWFSDRACARLGTWLGTKLPFDSKWTIEPISDSTLYPAYYIVSKYYNDGSIKLEQMTEEFFDYVYLGKGNFENISAKLKLDLNLLAQIRHDFLYWYPLDINLGGKEHQTVHFPVFIMNHIGILEPRHWPKGIMVNWWVIGKGTKISKSKGGAEPIPKAVEKYSVDAMRFYYAHIGSPYSDVVWDEPVVYNYRLALERIYSLFEELLDIKNSKENSIDKWLVSQVNSRIKTIRDAFDKFELRLAANEIYYELFEDFRWYQRRMGSNRPLIKEMLATYSKLLAPITPHLAEELNSILGKVDLVSTSKFPSYDESLINLDYKSSEENLKNTLSDVRNVLKMMKIDHPKEITLIIASKWKYTFASKLKKEMGITRNVGEIMKVMMQDSEIRAEAKNLDKLVLSIIKNPSKLPDVVTSQEFDLKVLNDSVAFLENEFGAKFNIVVAEESSEERKDMAMPGKVAMVVKE